MQNGARGALRTLALFCIIVLAFQPLANTSQTPMRIVAIGDVHGAYTDLVSILQQVGLIDKTLKWTGGSATFIQTGDILDRGVRVHECLDLLMGLESQAKKQGGRVIVLLGNHETMNMMGDLRYANAQVFRPFATSDSEKIREEAYRDYRRFILAHRDHSHQAVPDDDAFKRTWLAAHPPGYFEYRLAFGPDGKYGRWLRKLNVVVAAGEGLYVHAGLNPKLKFDTIDQLNSQARWEIAAFDSLWKSLSAKRVIWKHMRLDDAARHLQEEIAWMQKQGTTDSAQGELIREFLDYRSWLIVSTQGPLWYRGLAVDPEEELLEPLNAMLSRLKARYIVGGHTVSKGIVARFESRVFMIDSGMLSEVYEGQATALEVANGRFIAHYQNGERKILQGPATVKTPAAMPARTIKWIADYSPDLTNPRHMPW